MKVFVYTMNAGIVGTDTTFTVVGETQLALSELEDHLYDHATSYQEQDEDGEWPEGDPEIWLAGTATSLAELDEFTGNILTGHDTLDGLVEELEKDGMSFPDKKSLAKYR